MNSFFNFVEVTGKEGKKMSFYRLRAKRDPEYYTGTWFNFTYSLDLTFLNLYKEYIENWDKWNMALAEYYDLVEHKSLLSKELRSDDLINVHRKYFAESEEKN